MKRAIIILTVLTFLLTIIPLAGCSEKAEETDGKVLRISNCEDYMSTGDEEYVDLLVEFTNETGIEVEYSTYSTNENLYNELVINPNSYDIVIPSEYMIQKLATEGRLKKLDKSKIPSYSDVSPFIKDRLENITFTVKDGEYEGETASLDEFAVGYMWGTMGWVYNSEVVDKSDVTSWTGVFNNPKYNKRMTLKDSVRDTYLIGLGMVYEAELITAISNNDNASLNQIFNRTDKDSVDKVGDKLLSLKNKLYGFEVDSGKNDVVTGKIDAYVAWSGDAAYAIDEAYEDGKTLDYYVPDTGSNVWFDGMVMPAGSNNEDAVYKFIDFISRQENAVANMEYIGYSSVVGGDTVFEYVKDSFNDEDGDIEVDLTYFFGPGADRIIKTTEDGYGRLMAQYPEEHVVERCAVMSYFDEDASIRINNMWETVKGATFPVGLLIATGVIVVLLIVGVIFYKNRERLTWLRLPRIHKRTYTDKGYKVISKTPVE